MGNTDLLSVVRTASSITRRVVVSYSGGKDSAVVLDLCHKYFEHVDAFFMYQVPGLSFQEQTIRWAEQKYDLEILRIPHFEVSEFIKYGVYHDADDESPIVKVSEAYDYVREHFGTFWIAAGERIADSIVRRAMIVKDGTINEKRGRIFPIAHWRKAHVKAYIKQHDLRVSAEAAVLGYSFRDLSPRTVWLVRKHYPEDYQRIIAMYPQAEAAAAWWELYGNKQPE